MKFKKVFSIFRRERNKAAPTTATASTTRPLASVDLSAKASASLQASAPRPSASPTTTMTGTLVDGSSDPFLEASRDEQVVIATSDAPATGERSVSASSESVGSSDGPVSAIEPPAIPEPGPVVPPPDLESADVPSPSNPVEEPKSTRSAAFGVTKAAIGLVSSVADVFAPLKSVTSGLLYVMEHFDKMTRNQDDVARLAQRLTDLHSTFEKEGEQKAESGHQRVFLGKLTGFATSLDAMKEKHKLNKFVFAADDDVVISGIVEDIRDAILDYNVIRPSIA
ncbi:hypothetical protein DXG03_004428 [Asterophora parasitica]|uniref:Uncharacterized protein n=1 Tax=Asterophora parasitica TaxID=117018 RepID=A0A9P7K7V8_9AGAR|nr:hypothetical protein DXG03_004428 [Asterophora parasitica]